MNTFVIFYTDFIWRYLFDCFSSFEILFTIWSKIEKNLFHTYFLRSDKSVDLICSMVSKQSIHFKRTGFINKSKFKWNLNLIFDNGNKIRCFTLFILNLNIVLLLIPVLKYFLETVILIWCEWKFLIEIAMCLEIPKRNHSTEVNYVQMNLHWNFMIWNKWTVAVNLITSDFSSNIHWLDAL